MQDYTPEQLEAIKIADAIMQLKSHKLVRPVLGPEHTVWFYEQALWALQSWEMVCACVRWPFPSQFNSPHAERRLGSLLTGA